MYNSPATNGPAAVFYDRTTHHPCPDCGGIIPNGTSHWHHYTDAGALKGYPEKEPEPTPAYTRDEEMIAALREDNDRLRHKLQWHEGFEAAVYRLTGSR